MFDLFIPYLIGTAIGIADDGGTNSAVAVAVAEPAPVEQVTTQTTGRAPEEQVATGQYTTAIEVKPILGMTKGNWVAVRDYDGQDFLYFTHLMSWRCGLWDVRYGLNGAPATQTLAMEPCHLNTNSPNSMVAVEEFLPYITLPANFVESVTVEITYDDGTAETAQFERTEILIP